MIKRLSISHKVTLIIGASMVFFIGGGVCWNYWNVRRHVYAQMEARASALADELGYAFEVLSKHNLNFCLSRVVEQTATIGRVKEVLEKADGDLERPVKERTRELREIAADLQETRSNHSQVL